MAKRKLYWLCGIGALLLTFGITALGAAVKHEPSFYRQSRIPASSERKVLGHNFMSKFGQMLADRKQETWDCDVTEKEMNSFFAEIFDQMGETEGLRKLGISSPSVILLDDMHVRLAFRYGSGFFSTVISYDLKIWLVPKEPNVIAVEFLRARAGALPISNRSILQQLSDFAQKQNFQVNLYRHEGHSVAVIDLRNEPQNAASILTMLKIEPHRLSIRGKTLPSGLSPLDASRDFNKLASP
ncbi:MAG: hypothetical protein HYX68_26445 [Planctomycetes bacterium]|jgi:hypothetical protein|nr:hypothetical protein [Planctomycetota bacterium]